MIRKRGCLALVLASVSSALPANEWVSCREKADQTVAGLAVGDLEVLHSTGTPEIERARDEILKGWQALRAGWGNVLGTLDREVRRAPSDSGALLVRSYVRMERGTVRIQVACRSDGRVAGIYFKEVPDEQVRPAYVAPDYSRSETFDVQETSVGVKGLPAALAMPKMCKGKCPGIVLVQGSGPLDMDESVGAARPFRDLAEGLATRGLAVLRFDKRAYYDPASGSPKDTVIEEFVDDTVAALRQLQKSNRVDPNRLFVVAHSLSTTFAPDILQRASFVKGFVLLAAPIERMDRAMKRQMRTFGGRGVSVERSLAELDPQIENVTKLCKGQPAEANLPGGLSEAYWRSVACRDPVASMLNVDRPLLFLQGSEDRNVLPDDFRAWQRALRSRPDVGFRLLDGLDHLLISPTGSGDRARHVDGSVVDALADWIGKHH